MVRQTIPEKKLRSKTEIDKGIIKIRRRMDDINKLKVENISYDSGRKKAVLRNVTETIRDIFGSNSPEFGDFKYFDIDKGGCFMGRPASFYQQCFLDGIPDALALLEGIIQRLEERKEDLLLTSSEHEQETPFDTESRDIFIVHGHERASKEATARFLSQLGLNPIILHEQPNKGRTIIEKFEKHSNVPFAIALLTPDDLGSSKDNPQLSRPRARQNVIFELGFFIGKLGRKRVCALHQGETEILSDYKGVLFIEYDNKGAWKLKIARELKAAGIDIDLNRAV